MKMYDCIILGVGGVGSAALWAAAKKGWSVLGIDQFGPGHNKGSSHGHTRVIRRAYFEHPNYVPLIDRSYQLWDELTRRHRTSPDVKPLLIRTGLLQVGHPDSEVIQGVQSSATKFDLDVEKFSAAEIERRLPILKIPSEHVGLFEPGAGVLRVDLCVAAMIAQATKHGAEICTETKVNDWNVNDDQTVVVQTDRGDFRSKRVIVTGGAWSPGLLGDLGLDLKVLQKQQQWYQLDRVDQKHVNQFPSFFFEQDDGELFYGCPELDYLGMKVCRHSGGTAIDSPDRLTHDLDRSELARVESFLHNHFHFQHHRLVHHGGCLYTMTSDGHFIVDRYPGLEQVSFAAGLSGHGFKFVPVIGEYLVDLVAGQPRSEFDFLRIRNQSTE